MPSVTPPAMYASDPLYARLKPAAPLMPFVFTFSTTGTGVLLVSRSRSGSKPTARSVPAAPYTRCPVGE